MEESIDGGVTKHFLGKHIPQKYFQKNFHGKWTNFFGPPTSLKRAHIFDVRPKCIIFKFSFVGSVAENQKSAPNDLLKKTRPFI